MSNELVAESGKFRSGEESVFEGDRCIFIAPPAKFVPGQIKDLFDWMNRENNNIHPLIMSSIFHYEFVFIHPFADGNRRRNHRDDGSRQSDKPKSAVYHEKEIIYDILFAI